MSSGFHCLNGKFVKKEECFLHISDLSIQRSYAVFDYFIFIDKVPLYIDDNLIRFRNSIHSMELELKMKDQELKDLVTELIKINGQAKGGIKLLYTGGYAGNGYDGDNPNLIIMHTDFPVVPSAFYQTGVKLILQEFRRDFPTAKTTDYFFSLSIKRKIKAENAFDVLYEKDGYISESSRSNFFIIDQNDNVITPSEGILNGITRMHLLEAIRKDINVIERPLKTSEIKTCKEAFISSCVKRVMPVTQVGDLIIGDGNPGEITAKISEMLKQKDEEYIKNYHNI